MTTAPWSTAIRMIFGLLRINPDRVIIVASRSASETGERAVHRQWISTTRRSPVDDVLINTDRPRPPRSRYRASTLCGHRDSRVPTFRRHRPIDRFHRCLPASTVAIDAFGIARSDCRFRCVPGPRPRKLAVLLLVDARSYRRPSSCTSHFRVLETPRFPMEPVALTTCLRRRCRDSTDR